MEKMKVMDKGKDKVQKICDVIKRETLEPAQEEADGIVSAAKKEADKIVKKAKKDAEKHLEKARAKIEEERGVFLSSLKLAGRQGVAALREEIETRLFSGEVRDAVEAECKKPKVVASFITAMVAAVEKEGLGGKIIAEMPKSVDPAEVAAGLTKELLDKLEKKPVQVGELYGGAMLRIKDKEMTLDMSDETLEELLSTYAREDFRRFIFGSGDEKA
jgi:V/A-type H+/Na+-transporting ATPase subunit E